MAFIHSSSEECNKSELDLFQIAPTQTSIEGSFYVEVPPLTVVKESAPLDFFIAGNGEDYMDLNNTLLYLSCKIVKEDGSNIDRQAEVALVNYPIEAIFSQLDVTLGDRLLSQSNNCYPYRVFIESVLDYSKDTLSSQFSAGLFYKDTPGEHKSVDLDGQNWGFIQRAATAKYPVDHVSKKVFSLPAGSRITNQENLFLGQLPKLVVIGLVDNDSFSGTFNRNLFNFKHYDINVFAIYLSGYQIPAKPFQPDFQEGSCVRGYMSLVHASGKHMKDKELLVNREDFERGYRLFAFDLSPDQEYGDHYSLINSGNLRAEVWFARPFPQTVNMIVYGVFDNIIKINNQMNVLFDYM
ncbi:uncharacterized protein F54H12.2-like [Tiliqua scincoides]|uniref:uncharacterized protein F54H12.2-like n=1 Tax=Tiliqua scincoides TaxID=71010 RepID=UPI0034624840